MDKANHEPLYKKWWAWIGLFLVVATIVNAREQQAREQTRFYLEDTPVFEDAYEGEEDILALCCTGELISNDETPLAAQTFQVGTDLAPGEYFLMADPGTHGYLQVTRDNSGSVGSVIANKNFSTHVFIEVKEGEFLTWDRASLVPASEAQVPDFQEGVLGEGIYRVGIDIPPGTYRLIPNSSVAAYFQVSKNSRGTTDAIISNQNFSTELSLHLEAGQYLTLIRATLAQ